MGREQQVERVYNITRAIVAFCVAALGGWFIYIGPKALTLKVNSSAETKFVIQSLLVFGLLFVVFVICFEWRRRVLSAALIAYRQGERINVRVVRGVLVRLNISSSGFYLVYIRRKGRRVFSQRFLVSVQELPALCQLIGLEEKLKIRMEREIESELIAVLMNYFVQKTKGQILVPVEVCAETIGDRIVRIEKVADII